jgi:Plavaka transposase
MPTLDPDNAIGLGDVCDSPSLLSSESTSTTNKPVVTDQSPSFAPFPNITISRLMAWWYSGSGTKSASDLDRLVQNVLTQDDFEREHLQGFRAARECSRLDAYEKQESSPFSASGWTQHSVKIRLPAEYQQFKNESEAPEFAVSGVYIRNLVNVIRDAFQDPTALTFHMTPFKHFWKPSENAEVQRVFGELYSSDAMLREHEKIRTAPREPGCNLETTVAAIMLWSDSTHLASFGDASLWPIYAYFGNQSKYTHAKPTAFACHHLTYIPSVLFLRYYQVKY